MLRTRLWMGAVLIALATGVLIVDQWLAPWYPFLLALVLFVGAVACHELLSFVGAGLRPPPWLCYAAVTALLAANWPPALAAAHWLNFPLDPDPWAWIGSVFAAIVLAAFLVEMAGFRVPGESLARISLTVWLAAYLGLLPCFLVQLRWLPGQPGSARGTLALALAIFVPKSCDIGAYFAGRLVGRRPLAPVLSPKKTWEGAVGGLVTALVVAVGIARLGPVVRGGMYSAGALGIALGGAGMLGDLAESLIKRDCRRKDASQVVPGFGGVLDVIDAILFSAPIAYWWLK